MTTTLDTLNGQGWLQIGELLLAFLLSSLIGFERQLRGKSAGLRTQSIVGTTSALLLLVSKYGFTDVLIPGQIELDPSRVAAQIVSGVGFLGAGLILTRRGAVRGLTTAAAVWETAAIGMAAGAGLWLLALVVTALHFVLTYGYTALAHRLPGSRDTAAQLELVYDDGVGALRDILAQATLAGWSVQGLQLGNTPEADTGAKLVHMVLEVSGSDQPNRLLQAVGATAGVRSVNLLVQEELG